MDRGILMRGSFRGGKKESKNRSHFVPEGMSRSTRERKFFRQSQNSSQRHVEDAEEKKSASTVPNHNA